jgi:hypothetical protein
MSKTDLIDKFLHNALDTVHADVAHQFIEKVSKLERVTDIRQLFEPLCKG